MAWVVDSSVLIDVAIEDPRFGISSAKLLDNRRAEGLLVCPISFVELAPLFNGNLAAQQEFLLEVGITWPEQWTLVDTEAAFKAWHSYISARKAGHIPKRPIADILIGAFALRFSGLLTRNEAEFRRIFPSLRVFSVPS